MPSNSIIEKVIAGYKPLAYLEKKLYLYRKGKIYVLEGEKPEEIICVNQTGWKDATRASVRLFRREPKYAVPIDSSRMILAAYRRVYLIDVQMRTAQVVANSRDNFSDPLNICPAKKKWLAVWGDYGSNPDHQEIYIYGLKTDLTVEKIYCFGAGQIRHIHNIIPKKLGGYYVFAGDQEDGVGIYQADDEFKQMKPVKIGKQKYRAVIGYDTPKGLIYATDAVNEKNHIYLLQDREEPVEISDLNGSCIYGSIYGDGYLFSTSVEPDENNRGMTSWVSKKRGAGILTDEVHLVYVDQNLNVRTLLKYRKDFWPMKLMQYGSIQFPHGVTDELWIYPVAVRKMDGSAVCVK